MLLLKKITLAIFSVALCLCLAEVIARIKYHPQKLEFDGLFEYDSEKTYRLKSNSVGDFAGKEITTNQYGFRENNFSVEKAPNEWRVLFLGDSITFGHGIDFRDTFTQKYQAALGALEPSKKITTINAGVPGYSSMQEYYDFTQNQKLKPDVAVIQFTLNDVTEPFVFQLRLGGTGLDYHGVQDMSYWHFYLSQHSALYLFFSDLTKTIRFHSTDKAAIQSKAKHFEPLNEKQLVTDPSDPRQNTQWSEYFSWLKKFADACETAHIPCYVLISPYTFQLELDASKAIPQQKILAFANEHNLKTIDMLPVLREITRQKITSKYQLPADTPYEEILEVYLPDVQNIESEYFLDYDHYTAFGHSIVSDELMKTLKKP